MNITRGDYCTSFRNLNACTRREDVINQGEMDNSISKHQTLPGSLHGGVRFSLFIPAAIIEKNP